MKFIKSKSLGLKKIFFVLPPSDNDLKVKKLILGFLPTSTTMEESHKNFFAILFKDYLKN